MSDREPVDFVVAFAPVTPAPAAPLPLVPFGVWRFEVDDGEPWGHRAAARGDRSVRARLYADHSGERVILQDGALPIASGAAGGSPLLDTLARWPARAAAEIDAGGWASLRRASAATVIGPAKVAAGERFRDWCARPARRLWRWWREAARYDTWNVGIATLDRPLEDLRQLTALDPIRWLAPHRPLFYVADPFPYRHNGRDWLLVEAYGHPKGVRGHIARLDPFADPPVAAEPVIARDRHMSYPYVFEDGGDILCSPEMSQEDGCIIYRLHADGTWQPLHHILRGQPIVDPTFFRHDDRWWMLCTDREGGGSLTLSGYHAAVLAGPWQPHALNPLKCDLASARSAGRPFMVGGRLYRPAQDCSRTYGGAVTVMEIEALGPSVFRETPALRLDPDPRGPYPDGLHHLVVDGARVYLDGKKARHDHLLWWKAWR